MEQICGSAQPRYQSSGKSFPFSEAKWSALLCVSAAQCVQNPVHNLLAHSTQDNTEFTHDVSLPLLDTESLSFLSQHPNHQALYLAFWINVSWVIEPDKPKQV